MRTVELILKYTKHSAARLVPSGNAAIFSALYIAKHAGRKTVIIPDQGGWYSYRHYPRMLDMEVVEIKTDYGLITKEALDSVQLENSAVIVPSLAGYFAEQPIAEISKICRRSSCLLIEDASGSLSDETLCSARFSDIVIGSFGHGKPVNLGYGGFISAEQNLLTDEHLFSLFRFHSSFENELEKKLTELPQRLDSLYAKQKKVKKEINNLGFRLIHPDKRGINAVVRFENKGEKNKIVEYCRRNNLAFRICPLYIRVSTKAVSIEVKKEVNQC